MNLKLLLARGLLGISIISFITLIILIFKIQIEFPQFDISRWILLILKISILLLLISFVILLIVKLRKRMNLLIVKNDTEIPITLGMESDKSNYFEITYADLKKGGVIVGGIGTGKTTLRLNIMKQLINSGVSIIDIDYKGDAPRLSFFNSNGVVLVPGINLHIDLFNQPNHIEDEEFIGVLYRSFLEILTQDEVSAPQRQILYEAIKKTVVTKGNLHSFFKNIVIASMESKEIIDNYQQQTAIALVNKFNWLQTSMKNIFAVTGHSLDMQELISTNVYIDLSYIQHSAPNTHIRFLIDIIITKIMLYYKQVISSNFKLQGPQEKTLIFLDEAHLIMPKHSSNKLTKLEEVITTLRHKGLSVIATSTNASSLSQTLMDTAFFAQFRSEVNYLSQSKDGNIQGISSLPDFTFLLKCESTRYDVLKLVGEPYIDELMESKTYFDNLRKYDIQYLPQFSFDVGFLKIAILESAISSHLLSDPFRGYFQKYITNHLNEIVNELNIITLNSTYQKIIYLILGEYMNDYDIPQELKEQKYQTSFLYELVLSIFKFVFLKIHHGAISNNKMIKDFNNRYKSIFFDQILFIDELIQDINSQDDELLQYEEINNLESFT